MLLVYNRKKKLTKKQTLPTVELPSDHWLGVELVKQLELVRKSKKSMRCTVDNPNEPIYISESKKLTNRE